MQIKGSGGRLVTSRANREVKMIKVNNRHLGAVGKLSQNFKTGSKVNAMRERIQLKRMMVKATQEHYKDNPIVARRLHQDITQKASGIYGVEAEKLMSRGTQATRYHDGLNKQGGKTE